MRLEVYFERNLEGDVIESDDDTIVIEDVVAVRSTYNDLVRVEFTTAEKAEEASKLYGWDLWDENMVALKFHKGMIQCGERLFADWSLESEVV